MKHPEWNESPRAQPSAVILGPNFFSLKGNLSPDFKSFQLMQSGPSRLSLNLPLIRSAVIGTSYTKYIHSIGI